MVDLVKPLREQGNLPAAAALAIGQLAENVVRLAPVAPIPSLVTGTNPIALRLVDAGGNPIARAVALALGVYTDAAGTAFADATGAPGITAATVGTIVTGADTFDLVVVTSAAGLLTLTFVDDGADEYFFIPSIVRNGPLVDSPGSVVPVTIVAA